MIPRLVRLVVVGIVASAADAGSTQAFAPVAGAAQINQSQAANSPVTRVHDRWHHGRAIHARPPAVVVRPHHHLHVRPHHHVGDGLCVTRQPVTSMSCYDYLREQRFRSHFAHHGHVHGGHVHGDHVHGPGCGHTPRWGHRHNQIVFLGWF